jgi:phosphoribulokinase
MNRASARPGTNVHDDEAALYGCAPGTFTDWEALPEHSDLLFYEGLHGAVKADRVNISQYPDLKIGVVPQSAGALVGGGRGGAEPVGGPDRRF